MIQPHGHVQLETSSNKERTAGACNRKTAYNSNRDGLKMNEVIFGSSSPEYRESVLFFLVIIVFILFEILDLGCPSESK